MTTRLRGQQRERKLDTSTQQHNSSIFIGYSIWKIKQVVNVMFCLDCMCEHFVSSTRRPCLRIQIRANSRGTARVFEDRKQLLTFRDPALQCHRAGQSARPKSRRYHRFWGRHFSQALQRQFGSKSARVGGTTDYRLKHAKGFRVPPWHSNRHSDPPWHA